MSAPNVLQFDNGQEFGNHITEKFANMKQKFKVLPVL